MHRTIATVGVACGLVLPLLLGGGSAFAAQNGEPLDAPMLVDTVATRGPEGSLDEFVVLRNASTTTSIDLGTGWTVKTCDPFDGTWSTLYTATTGSVPPLGLFTLARAGSGSAAGANDTFTGDDISDFGGVGIYEPTPDGLQLQDSVGFSSGCSTLPAEPQRSNTDPPHRRIGPDTNLDRVDFQKL